MTTLSTELLDYIAEQLDTDDTTSNGKAFVNYEDTDNDIVIEGSVQWQGGFVDKFMDIDGHKYLDCTEYERTDFSNLQVDAWVKGEKVAVDLGYIEDKLSINL